MTKDGNKPEEVSTVKFRNKGGTPAIVIDKKAIAEYKKKKKLQAKKLIEVMKDVIDEPSEVVTKTPKKKPIQPKITEVPLSDKQKQFCIEYIKDSNAKQSAIRAGYSKATAESKGSQLLRLVKVKEEIARLRKPLTEEALVTAEYVINVLKEAIEIGTQKKKVVNYRWDDELKDRYEREEYVLDLPNVLKSAELLGKTLGIFIEKQETVNKNNNINVNQTLDDLDYEKLDQIEKIMTSGK